MKNLLVKAAKQAIVYSIGVTEGMFAKDTLVVATAVGVYKGVKSGDVMDGINAGVRAGACVCVAHGLASVALNLAEEAGVTDEQED